MEFQAIIYRLNDLMDELSPLIVKNEQYLPEAEQELFHVLLSNLESLRNSLVKENNLIMQKQDENMVNIEIKKNK